MDEKAHLESETAINTKEIAWALKEIRRNHDDHEKARRYYRGDHPLNFATEKFRNAFGNTFGELKINLCEMVVKTIASRIKVSSFSVNLKRKSTKKDKTLSETISEETDNVWELNRMRTRIRSLFRESVLCGESFLIVWPDSEAEGEIVWYPQRAGECAVKYHPEKPGYIVQGAKAWMQEDKKLRLTLYFRDRIEKYVTASKVETWPENAQAFERMSVDGESWPLPNPYDKCPIFHFPFNDERRSVLVNLYGPQDGLNKTECDKMVSMEFFAQPQRWAIGVEEEDEDEATAAAEAWKAAADRLWTTENDTAKFGQFDPSDPGAYLQVKADFRTDFAIIAGIPTYHFDMRGGDIPSGAALSILESRFNEQVEDLQDAWGTPLADAMLLSLRMKKIAAATSIRLKTDFHDTTPRDPKAEAETQEAKQRVGVSKRQSLRELDYSESKIDEMSQERADETAAAGDAMSQLFNAGQV